MSNSQYWHCNSLLHSTCRWLYQADRKLIILPWLCLAIFYCFKFIRSSKRCCKNCSLHFLWQNLQLLLYFKGSSPHFGVFCTRPSKTRIQACIAINKKDDDRRAILKNAQQARGEVMQGKEDAAPGKKQEHNAWVAYTLRQNISWIIFSKTRI